MGFCSAHKNPASPQCLTKPTKQEQSKFSTFAIYIEASEGVGRASGVFIWGASTAFRRWITLTIILLLGRQSFTAREKARHSVISVFFVADSNNLWMLSGLRIPRWNYRLYACFMRPSLALLCLLLIIIPTNLSLSLSVLTTLCVSYHFISYTCAQHNVSHSLLAAFSFTKLMIALLAHEQWSCLRSLVSYLQTLIEDAFCFPSH
jgi:hypothetical protein